MLDRIESVGRGETIIMKQAAVFALALLISATIAVTASAKEPANPAGQAKSEIQQSKDLAAYNKMREATLKVWKKGPLLFRKALFVSGRPAAFGIYNPRPNSVFKSGEKLVISVEPVGFTWQTKNGLNHAALVVDLAVKDSKGKVGARQKGFSKFSFNSREQNMEILTAVTIDLSGAPLGKYAAELTFHDTVGGKSASFELPFEIKN